MKNLTITLAIAGLVAFPIMAQSPAGSQPEEETNVVERILRESNGTVEIDIPEDILEQILKEEKPVQKRENLNPGLNKMQGYRIQVFSDGRNQRSLESRARARGNAIVARFPKYRGQVYSYSSAPNWYTRIGNFRTQEEALGALAELKRAFPQYAAEMRVVKSQIVIIK